MKDVLVAVLAAVGLAFSFSGAVGVWRMPDLYSRVQAATKTITMGAVPAVLALVVATGLVTPYTSRVLLVGFLIVVLNPASSHALTRAAYKTGIKQWPGAVVDEGEQR